MINYTSEKAVPSPRQLPQDEPEIDRSVSGMMSPLFDQLIRPTWAETDEARTRYNLDAKRLRRWRWWFIAMFTLYTTLSGILLLKLIAGA